MIEKRSFKVVKGLEFKKEDVFEEDLPIKEEFAQQFREIPQTSGIYIFYDENDQSLYVGKAKVLRSRIIFHFNQYLHRQKCRILLQETFSKYSPEEIIEKLSISRISRWETEVDRWFDGFDDTSAIERVMDSVKRVEIEEIDKKTKLREIELIAALKPLFNSEVESEEYDDVKHLDDELYDLREIWDKFQLARLRIMRNNVENENS